MGTNVYRCRPYGSKWLQVQVVLDARFDGCRSLLWVQVKVVFISVG